MTVMQKSNKETCLNAMATFNEERNKEKKE